MSFLQVYHEEVHSFL